jgi:hypothetical protein
MTETFNPTPAPRKKRVAIVDTSSALEEQSRDIAEEKLTTAAGELHGVSGFVSKIWKHNLFREYYRQKEITKAKGDISLSGNLYAGEGANRTAHNEAMGNIVDRFTTDYDETIHTEAGEEKRVLDDATPEGQRLNLETRILIRDYASGIINEAAFRVERDRIVADATGLSGEQLRVAVNHTDNLLEIARQSKLAFEHGESLDAIDQEVEIVVGKAKLGVRTEAKYNTVDRIAAKLQSTRLGKFVNESTISAGVAIAYSLTVGLSQRLARSKVFAIGTLGASALLGGVIAGARESVKVADERRQHSRERAKGKEMDPSMKRREEMEETIYKTASASALTESITNLADNVTNDNDFLGAMNELAIAESRIKLSDTEKIDLLSYSDFKSVEKERLALDIARAQAKVKLRNLAQSGAFSTPSGQPFDDYYDSAVQAQSAFLRVGPEGMTAKDRVFQKMRRKKVAGAVFKAAVTGVVIGGVAQELGAFASDSKEGLFEHWLGNNGGHKPEGVTALDGLRRWVMGEHVPVRALHDSILPDGSKVTLPDGVEIAPNPKTPGEFLFTKDGEVVSDKIQFADGKLTEASEEILKQQGVDVGHSITYVNESHEVTTTTKGFANEHPELFKPIHRKFWYDNNTSIFDKNELRLHWGGQNGTGITVDGHYSFNVAKMTPDGSTFKDLSIQAQEEIKAGKLSMLLSLSRDTQMNAVEVPIDTSGNAIIDPESPVGKMFFKTTDGKLTFIGKFAEVAHQSGLAPDGAPQYEILATHVGAGIEAVPDQTVTTFTNTIVENPVTSFQVTDTEPYVTPFVPMPLFGRTPLERMRNGVPRPPVGPGGYYGYGEPPEAESWQENFSPRIRENPNAQLNPQEEVNWYFEDQENRNPGYAENELLPLHEQNPEKMGKNVEGVVCLAVAGHQEHKNIFRTLETYRVQQDKKGKSIWNGDKSKFEILVFVNWPEGKDPQLTLDEIERFKREHPEVPVRVYTEEITTGKIELGWYKKKVFDLGLKRHQERANGKDIILIANDADMVFSSPLYLESVREAMAKPENTSLDALVGRYDLDPNIYEKHPAFHTVMRFWQFMESAMRQKYAMVGTQGRNTIMRGSSYAAVGGNRTREFWADVEFGQLFDTARRRKDTVAYLNNSWVMVDPRREVDKFLSGEKVAHTWFDFNTREVRGTKSPYTTTSNLDAEALAGLPETDAEVITFKNRIEDEIKEIINVFFPPINQGYISSSDMAEKHFADVKELTEKAARLMGLKIEVTHDGQKLELHILDTTELRKNLKDYKLKNRKEVKLNSRNRRNPLL